MIRQHIISLFAILFVAGTFIFSCTTSEASEESAEVAMTNEEYVLHGKYLANVAGCHDCHTPKDFSTGTMQLDESRLLSGHPQGSPLPPVDVKALQPGYWTLFTGDLTAGIGPWGMSFASNLTPHETGIKGWSLEVFMKALRTGKHMGVEQGRPIMPPMPWVNLAQATDEDLKAIYMFLQSLPPIDNVVPEPKSPDQVLQMIEEEASM